MFKRGSRRILPIELEVDTLDVEELTETVGDRARARSKSPVGRSAPSVEYANSRELEIEVDDFRRSASNQSLPQDRSGDASDSAPPAHPPVNRTASLRKSLSGERHPRRDDDGESLTPAFLSKQQLFAHDTDAPLAITAKMLRRPSIGGIGGLQRRDSFLNPINTALPQAVRLVSFQTFKARGKFPLYEEDRSVCSDISDLNTSDALVVLIAYNHRHLGADMYSVCVEGIQRLLAQHRMKTCFVWMDKCCLRQNADVNELTNLSVILSLVDCIFTPIASECVFLKPVIEQWDAEYPCAEWNHPSEGFLAQSVNRLLIFHSLCVPVNAAKATQLSKPFALYFSQNYRPHVLFGAAEMRSCKAPYLLPPVNFSYLPVYDPKVGSASPNYEAELMGALVDHMAALVRYAKPGWYGEFNEEGLPHGQGVLVADNWSVYEGAMLDGQLTGRGRMRYPSGNCYEGDWVDGQKEGQGAHRSVHGAEYSGGYKGNRRHGQGRYVFASGVEYEGQWDGDQSHGQGRMTYLDGSVYEGEFVRDAIRGRGRFRYANGSTYEGDWLDGRREGSGVHRCADGVTYEGEWRGDRRSGQGRHSAPGGDFYQGEFADDKRSGRGVGRLTMADGGVYEGEFFGGALGGRGVYRWPNGNAYEGDWREGAMTGRGVYSWAQDKARYEGDYVRGVRKGRGVFEYADGGRYEGDFDEDSMHGQGVYVYPEKSSYSGDWVRGERTGRGTFTDAAGNVYIGEFEKGAMTGYGRLTYVNGDAYEGFWVQNRHHGDGRMTFADGGVQEGEYVDGRLTLKRQVALHPLRILLESSRRDEKSQ